MENEKRSADVISKLQREQFEAALKAERDKLELERQRANDLIKMAQETVERERKDRDATKDAHINDLVR